MAEVFGCLRRRLLVFASVVFSSVLVSSASAELFVYEPFDYPAGEQLIGKSGGVGFTGPWRDETIAGAATIQPGLTYPGLPVSGNSVLMSGATGILQIFRSHNNIVGADGTTTWLSYIGQRLGPIQDPPANPNNPYPRGVNISFYNTEVQGSPARERFAIGSSSGGPTNDWAFIGQGQVANFLPAANPPVPYGGGPPVFVVIRIDHHGPPDVVTGVENFDDVHLFINPDPAAEPSLATANAKRLGTEPNAFDYSGLDYLRPFIGNTNGANPYGELLWDELRIGSTYADVVGSSAIPLLPGDTNGNGIGGEFPDDFEPIRANFRLPVTMRSEGDLESNGVVDLNDFRQWKAAFLAGGGSLAEVDLGFLTNVPEPTAAMLALFAASIALAVGARRKRR